MAGLLGDLNPLGGLLSDTEQQSVNRNTLLNLGSSLLAGSGWSSHPTTFGQILGGAIPPALQAQQSMTENLLKSKLFKQKFEEAQREQDFMLNQLPGIIGASPYIKDYKVPQEGEMGESYSQQQLIPGSGFIGGKLSPEQFFASMVPAGGDIGKTGLEGISAIVRSNITASQNKKGLYGGIQYGFDPKTKQYVPYSFDEATGTPIPLGVPNGLQATVPMIPQITTGGNIVTIPSRGVPGTNPTVTGTGLQTQPTAEELTKTGQQGFGVEQLNKLRKYVEDKKIEVGPVAGRSLRYKAQIPGVELTNEEADAISTEEQLSNMLLQAMRGAQVGPAEQAKFEKQLPRLEHNEKVFKANIDNTIQNLKYLNELAAKTRAVPNVTKTNRNPILDKYGIK